MFHLNSTQLNTHTNKNDRACCCQNVPKKGSYVSKIQQRNYNTEAKETT